MIILSRCFCSGTTVEYDLIAGRTGRSRIMASKRNPKKLIDLKSGGRRQELVGGNSATLDRGYDSYDDINEYTGVEGGDGVYK